MVGIFGRGEGRETSFRRCLEHPAFSASPLWSNQRPTQEAMAWDKNCGHFRPLLLYLRYPPSGPSRRKESIDRGRHRHLQTPGISQGPDWKMIG